MPCQCFGLSHHSHSRSGRTRSSGSSSGQVRPDPNCEYCRGKGSFTSTGTHWVERTCHRCKGDTNFRESRICTLTDCKRDRNCWQCHGRGRYKDQSVKCVQCGGNGYTRVQEYGCFTQNCDCHGHY